ncbi:MAG: hypothetical protein ACK4WH_00965 [Phycisphaerales bacterium]
MEAWRERERRLDYRAAVVACSIAGGRPGDLFPSLAPDPPGPEDLDAKIERAMRAYL